MDEYGHILASGDGLVIFNGFKQMYAQNTTCEVASQPAISLFSSHIHNPHYRNYSFPRRVAGHNGRKEAKRALQLQSPFVGLAPVFLFFYYQKTQHPSEPGGEAPQSFGQG